MQDLVADGHPSNPHAAAPAARQRRHVGVHRVERSQPLPTRVRHGDRPAEQASALRREGDGHQDHVDGQDVPEAPDGLHDARGGQRRAAASDGRRRCQREAEHRDQSREEGEHGIADRAQQQTWGLPPAPHAPGPSSVVEPRGHLRGGRQRRELLALLLLCGDIDGLRHPNTAPSRLQRALDEACILHAGLTRGGREMGVQAHGDLRLGEARRQRCTEGGEPTIDKRHVIMRLEALE
mmetsp:Transcript_56097/g.181993  ORF Transcript_56097/g.181993 Transcript_56097/m.181993 type:complete len:237 (-) Transcript_56097:1640-2350(-)